MPLILIAGAVVLLVFVLTRSASGQDSADGNSGDETLTSGSKLDAGQIAQLAANAGFSGDDLAKAVAVALAESGGYTGSYNPVSHYDSGKVADTPQGQGAIGLWQIYAHVHPEFDAAQLYDPAYNASAAYSIYSKAGNSFHPWSTWTNGAWQNHFNDAADAVAQLENVMTPDQSCVNCEGVS